MRKKIIKFVMQSMESSARKAAMGSKQALFGAKKLPDALKRKNLHE